MMLLDHEDRRVVLSAIMRKAVESAGLVSNPTISVAKKNIIVKSVQCKGYVFLRRRG